MAMGIWTSCWPRDGYPLLDRVLLNDGKGAFLAADLAPTPDRTPYSAVLADIDGDLDLDILVSNDTPDRKVVYVNDGKARFRVAGASGRAGMVDENAAVQIEWSRTTRCRRRKPARPECMSASKMAAAIPGPCSSLPIGSAPTSVVPADFNNDGPSISPYRTATEAKVWSSSMTVGRILPGAFPFGPASAAARVAAAADFNADRWQDLVVGDERAASMVSAYTNNGKGGFSPGFQTSDRGRVPYALEAGDLNRDGKPDIVIGYIGAPSAVFFNDGSGKQFTEVRFGDARGDAYGFALGDLNSDGYPDIALARSGAPNVMYANQK